MTLFEAGEVIGGQFDLARRIPGKEEFSETIRYYTRMLDKHGVDVRLRTRATVDELAGFDEVVLATGVTPRMPDIPGIDHPMVLSYAEAITGEPVGKTRGRRRRGRHRLRRERVPGDRRRLGRPTNTGPSTSRSGRPSGAWPIRRRHAARWRHRFPRRRRARCICCSGPRARRAKRLGKTSGWVHRASLKAKGVQQLSGVNYERIDDDGLHISFGPDRSDPRVLEVDNVVICAGQESVRDLEDGLRGRGIEPHVIGGAALAAELDAKRAIRQGTELAARL